MIHRPVHRGIVILDIEAFGRRDRTDMTRLRMRGALYRIFKQGLRRASITEPERTLKDQGDGILALFQPQVSKLSLINPLVSELVVRLEAYNRDADEQSRMRLRVAVHAGEMMQHSMDGVTDYVGEDLNHAFRLLESRAVRQRLAATEAPLALIVSQLIYDGVIRQGYPDIDASSYEHVLVTIKETRRASAWVWTPRRMAASDSYGDLQGRRPDEDPAAVDSSGRWGCRTSGSGRQVATR